MPVKKVFLLFFIICNYHSVHAQMVAFNPSRYWVHFTNKGHNTNSLSNPSAYLSAYSIARKQRHSIVIDSADLPVTKAYIDSIRSTGCIVLNPSRWLNAVTVKCQDSIQLKKTLRFSFVSGVKPVGNIAPHEACTNDTVSPFYAPDTLLYGAAYHQLQQINLPLLHAYGYKGRGIRIAVLDAGFNNIDRWAAFDSLFHQNRYLDFHDFVRHRSDSAFYWNDHGAMVLSAIEANSPGKYVGSATEAGIALYHSEDAATENPIEEDNWCSAAERADSLGVDIISSSLGYTTFDSAYFNLHYGDLNGKTAHISLAATIATRKGILVCNSAGNEGNNSWYVVGTPADADSILAVGAVDATGTIASFSSHGPTVDGRIKPDIVAMGYHTALISPYNGNVITSSGTSFSNPIMAGAAACLWSICPKASNMDIRSAIIQSSDRFHNPDNSYGYGLPDMVKAAKILLKTADCASALQTPFPFNQQIVTFYPNPTSDRLYFAFTAPNVSPVKMIWHDVTGRLILEQDFTPALPGLNRVLALSSINWLPGLYFCSIQIGGNTYTRRILFTGHP